MATLTTVQPTGRFGSLDISKEQEVLTFKEKVKGDGGSINGGFFVLQPEIFQFLEDEKPVFEKEPLEKLASLGQLMAFRHTGFWQPMDTLRDKII
jgi:glucose-1-phosphate cytidylyltransferase